MTSAAVAADTASPVPRARRQAGARDAAAALEEVAVAAAALRASAAVLEQKRDGAVRAAVAAGATWTQIGQALGVSPQAAHKRFKGLALAGRKQEAGQQDTPPTAPPVNRG